MNVQVESYKEPRSGFNVGLLIGLVCGIALCLVGIMVIN